jgi:transketolase
MDVNDQQCDGAMSSVMEVGDIRAKFLNFGAACVEIDGHDLTAMRDAVREPHSGKPLIILARTNPFHAMPILKERFPRLHYVRFKSEDERARMNLSIARDLGIDPISYTH